MNKSESTKEIAAALAKVQAVLKGAAKDSVNPFFHSTYADLASVWEACRKPLSDNGLSVVQTTAVGEGHALIVETTLLHISGEWISGQMPMLLNKQDPQGIGQAITYGRRYGLSAIVGICPEDDDAEPERKEPPKKTVKKTEPPEFNLDLMESSLKRLGEANPEKWGHTVVAGKLMNLGARGDTMRDLLFTLSNVGRDKLSKAVSTALAGVQNV